MGAAGNLGRFNWRPTAALEAGLTDVVPSATTVTVGHVTESTRSPADPPEPSRFLMALAITDKKPAGRLQITVDVASNLSLNPKCSY